jgi:hypothetical protein
MFPICYDYFAIFVSIQVAKDNYHHSDTFSSKCALEISNMGFVIPTIDYALQWKEGEGTY